MELTSTSEPTSHTSVERALAIFEAFERERRPLSLKELADSCRIPASTCHGLIRTLLKRSYIYQAGRRKELYPTRRLYEMGATIVAHDQLLRRLSPILEQLREATHETVILGQRQQVRVLYLAVLEGDQAIRYSARAGDTKPLHSSSIGKATLGVLADDQVRALVALAGTPRVTERTITGTDAIVENLAEGRRMGAYVTHGENVVDVTAAAVPVPIHDQVFGLALAGPSHRMEPRLKEWIAQLLESRQAMLEAMTTG